MCYWKTGSPSIRVYVTKAEEGLQEGLGETEEPSAYGATCSGLRTGLRSSRLESHPVGFPKFQGVGVAFHWTQAVWKRIQACGLATEYNAGGDLQKILRRLLALPLLPAEHIVQVFNSERAKAANNPRLMEVFQYINDQWIENATWAPCDWSVYGQAVRTNNDCEGYHRRLNTRAQSPPPFYVLVELLHGEAKFVSTQLKLVSMKKLTKHQKKTTKQTESKIFSTWAEYAEGGMSAESGSFENCQEFIPSDKNVD